MISTQGRYTFPTGYIEELTNHELIFYQYDTVQAKTPLQIDTINQQLILNGTETVSYHFPYNNILTKTQLDPEGETTLIYYTRLLPTAIHYPIEKILKKQFKMRKEDGPSNMYKQILDFGNTNILQSVQLGIENILGTHCIVGRSRKDLNFFLPIKEIHEDHLLIYGLDPIDGYAKLEEHIPKDESPIQGKPDVFTEPKLDLLIEELAAQKDRLTQKIEKASKEWEFLTAHHLAEVYRKVNKKFNALSAIKNKNHHHITTYEMMVRRQKESLEEETDDIRLTASRDFIEENEEKLEKLKAQQHKLRPETYKLKEALHELCDQSIKGIRLILKEKHQTSLKMSLQKNDLILVLECNGNEGYLDCDFKTLLRMGFKAEGHHYKYIFEDFDKEKIEDILTLLSRFTFDVFYAGSLDTPMKLIIT